MVGRQSKLTVTNGDKGGGGGGQKSHCCRVVEKAKHSCSDLDQTMVPTSNHKTFCLGDIWDGKMQPGFSIRGRFFCRNVILGV